MSDVNETLNAVLDTFRGVLIAVASGTGADMGKVADTLESMSASPQFHPYAQQMLAQLGKEMSEMRSK